MLLLLRYNETVQEFAWRIIKSIPQQYRISWSFVICIKKEVLQMQEEEHKDMEWNKG